MNRKPKKRDDNHLNYYAKKIFGSWNNLMKAAGYKTRFYQKIGEAKLDENFAYFLGLVITDGHIVSDDNSKKYQVAIYTSYPEEKEMLLKLIKKLFNYRAGVSSRMYGFNKRPNFEVRISSKRLAQILINEFNIPAGAKSLNVSIPEKIKNANIKIKSAFLRGTIDGDGSVSIKSVKIASGSVKFLGDTKELLEQMNIPPGNIIRDNKTTNTFSIRINKYQDLIKIKEIYNSKYYYYERKKRIIDKI